MCNERIKLNHTFNTRTLSNLVNKDGYHIKENMLIRSDALDKLDSSDIRVLTEEYNLKKIIDFRTETEVFNKPDVVIKGTSYHHIPILGSDKIGISKKGEKEDFDAFVKLLHDRGIESSINYMVRTYKSLVDNEHAKKGYSLFLKELLNQCSGATLWHCSAGKDRCGFGVILVLYLLDFNWNDIIEDYMATNKYYSEQISRLTENFGDKYYSILDCLYTVKKIYIDTLLETINLEYGSIDGFIKNGLNFSDNDKERLKNIYLTK